MRKIIFYIIIIILLVPAIEKQVKFFHFKELKGAFYPKNNISLSLEGWFTEEYQQKKEEYIKDNIGFKIFFIRSYNQLSFSIFKMANNHGGIVGKNNYLYLDEYIYNEKGQNYVGDKIIKQRVENLKALQNFFKSKNILLLTMFLPSKASFYPEYIPSHFAKFPKSNYTELIRLYDSLQVNYIDVNKYFLEIKDTCKIPLFPKNGLHWTSYGMALGIDTLIKAIEKYKNIDLPDMSWEKPIKLSAENHHPDFDEEEAMNLIFQLPREKMPYPEFIYNNDNTKTKPKTLVISDSYYWQVYEQYVHHNVFDMGGFWYYFKTARQRENKLETVMPVDSIADLPRKLLEQNIIVLFASQATLHLFPYSFDEKAMEMFKYYDYDLLTEYYYLNIKHNTKLLKQIIEKAKTNNISIEKQIKLDAIWLTNNYFKEHNPKELEIRKIIEEIKMNNDLLNKIKEKSIVNNIPFNKMIRLDAEWIYNHK